MRCFSYLSNFINNYGTYFMYGDENHHAKSIANAVIPKVLKGCNDAIKATPQYQDRYLTGWVGPSPIEHASPWQSGGSSKIGDYLERHSIRKGFFGKLVALIYKIKEAVKECFNGDSDKLRALDDIEGLLNQRDMLLNPNYRVNLMHGLIPTLRKESVQAVQTEAKNLLAQMLNEYNTMTALPTARSQALSNISSYT